MNRIMMRNRTFVDALRQVSEKYPVDGSTNVSTIRSNPANRP